MLALAKHALKGQLHRALWFQLEERLSRPGLSRELDASIEGVIAWLLRAQAATNDDGVAESYRVLTKSWFPSYPETTGYIICSLLRAADAGFDRSGRLNDASRRMGRWLVTTQLADGAFPGGNISFRPVRPAVFNTGQILKGLTDLIVRDMDPSGEMTSAAERACNWLIEVQDPDGCWRRGISRLTTEPVHAYNVRTAWALARYGIRLNRSDAVAAASANGRWVLSLQDSGTDWIPHMNFDAGVPPLTHTMAYTIRGLLELGALLQDNAMISGATRAARRMFELQHPVHGTFPGQFSDAWKPIGSWTSLTGNAQMAIIGYRLSQITGETEWRDRARKTLNFCRGLQEFDHADPGRRGAIRGSYPGSVGYGRYWYMNWTQKFYLDALLADAGRGIN